MAKVFCVVLCACVGAVLAQHLYIPVSGSTDPNYLLTQIIAGRAGPLQGHTHGPNSVLGAVGGYQGQQVSSPQQAGPNYGSYNSPVGPIIGHRASDPANNYIDSSSYDFEYQVVDPSSQLSFGHLEQRRGDNTNGMFHILLPDGRTQQVQYIADQDGYKPIVSYHQYGNNVDNVAANRGRSYREAGNSGSRSSDNSQNNDNRQSSGNSHTGSPAY